MDDQGKQGLMSAAQRVLRVRDVIEKTGLRRSTIYKAMAQYGFPRPVRITPRAVGWVEAEVDLWLERKIEQRGVSA